MPKHYRFAVYCSAHPAYGMSLLGRYRWRWLAELRAWLYRNASGGLLWPDAHVRVEDVTVYVKDGKSV